MDSLNFTHQGQPQQITEGIYFGMPEDLYHAIPALSSTGIKNILISAPDFYANSWLNPFREEDSEDGDASEWRKFGKASHTRNLEGKKVFDQLYCQEFIAPEGCLETKDDLIKACDDLGVPTKKSWKKELIVNALLGTNPNALIADFEREKYARETGGRIQMSQKELRHIEVAAAMIEKHPDLKHCFTGGYPEVTIIWKETFPATDVLPEITIWFKARLDYLKARAIVDLKTFTNKRHKPIDSALHETMAGLKYHIQVVFYVGAALKAIEFAKRGITTTYSVHRFGPSPDFLQELAASEGHEFFLVFQKKGGAPLARGKKFNSNLRMYECAGVSINQGIDLYRRYLELFGTEMWVDVSNITDFEDDQFPVWATEI